MRLRVKLRLRGLGVGWKGTEGVFWSLSILDWERAGSNQVFFAGKLPVTRR